MPTRQDHIGPQTPMGANLIADGATFRVWAPRARHVYISGNFNQWQHRDADLLVKDAAGYWTGFLAGVRDGDQYKFWVEGAGTQGHKRDPYARELSTAPAYPDCDCIVRNPTTYPWHDGDFRSPAFNDLILYELHVGTFYGPDRVNTPGNFLDVLDRLEYLVALGVNAIELLPVTEFASPRGMGYGGSDLFSPEMDYGVEPAQLGPYLTRVNNLLARRGHTGLTHGQLAVPINQLKALIDVCHVYGLAVLFDVVYNHAGYEIRGQKESIYFFDRAAGTDPNDSLYFIDREHVGGPVFAIHKQEVRQFLIDNAGFFVTEYHVDGFRYDQVSVIVKENLNNGWGVCQDLTDTVRASDPSAVQVAEYWKWEYGVDPIDPWVIRSRAEQGAGFDATWHYGLRESIRGAIGQAAGGRESRVDLDAIARYLYPYPPHFPAAWKAMHYIESHDEVYDKDKKLRIPRLAHPNRQGEPSWYECSRSRVATGLLLTAPGIPMLFMGQEFLEDKSWSDDPKDPDTLIWWEGLGRGESPLADHLRFTQELIGIRRRHPALRGEHINVFHVHNDNRVIAFQRWLEGAGQDVVVVASLNESTYDEYRLGFPQAGRWLEVFNSDIYDHWVNPWGRGNGGSIEASGPPMHDQPYSAGIVIPANSLLVFARE